MQIVASSYFLRHLRNLDFFTLDFGKAKKDPKTDNFRKVDEFIIRYKSLYNKQILKFGKIGNKITFYEDLSIKNNDYKIFKGDDIYEISFTKEDLKDIENYILETLRKIDINEEEDEKRLKENEEKLKEMMGNDWWTPPTDDIKNKGKKYSVDQTLSREKYREEIKKKFVEPKSKKIIK